MRRAVPAGRQGFTLVELIVSMTLMVILAGGMLFSFGQGLRSWKKVARCSERLQIENIIAERITSDIRCATEILTGSGSQEIFLKIDSDLVSYKLVEHKVKRMSAYLTCEDEIKKLSFSYPSPGKVQVMLDDFAWKTSIGN